MTEAAPDAAALQFGVAEPGQTYRDRPAAFGVAPRADGRIAVVHIRRPGQDYIDLPGGAIEPGETEDAALIREFGEETGLVVTAGRLLSRSSQYLVTAHGETANNRAAHLVAVVTGEDAGLKIEDDHTLEWRDPLEALAELRHDSHAWAVAAWLRAGRPR
jgi:8-oxo-dGTP diphosphatase